MAVKERREVVEPITVTERPPRVVYVRDSFFSKAWATLRETVLHPFTTTVLRYERRDRSGNLVGPNSDR